MKHIWETEDGEVDDYAFSSGDCNGPICERCGFSFCVWCTPEKWEDESCPDDAGLLAQKAHSFKNRIIWLLKDKSGLDLSIADIAFLTNDSIVEILPAIKICDSWTSAIKARAEALGIELEV